MTNYAITYRSSDTTPALVSARNISDALDFARKNAVLRDGRHAADMADADLAGNLSVETPRGRRHYWPAG